MHAYYACHAIIADFDLVTYVSHCLYFQLKYLFMENVIKKRVLSCIRHTLPHAKLNLLTYVPFGKHFHGILLGCHLNFNVHNGYLLIWECFAIKMHVHMQK